MTSFRRITIAFAFILAPACSSTDTSTVGQLIECDVAADGTTSNCHPTDQTETDNPDKCIDRDEDGDDDPFDDEDEAESEKVNRLVTPDDEDGDGTPDTEDDDDDDDGVPDVDDCDEEAGGQSDEADDDDSVDDDL